MKRMQKDIRLLVFGAADTSKSDNYNENGWIELLVLIVPAFTNPVTVSKIEVFDNDGTLIYSNTSGWDQSTTTPIPSVKIPIAVGFSGGSYSVKATLSGAPGGTGGTIQVKSYIKANG